MSHPEQAGTVVPLDEAGLAQALAAHPLLVIAFWAPWCGPCQAFAPVFAQAAARLGDVLFGKINVEAEPSLAAAFGVRSIPCVMGVREGVVLYLQPGALGERDLIALVDHLRAVDMAKVRAALPALQEGGA